ncbi:MAG TPA: Gfo/Idh/MocA family oxidoreductase [Acidimicrobiia bacterium]|jgi:predicted dehydrogenase|nr:Gfo/Idh/MocA family oxidoreductase [Acidimicrobiia bacterium]
MDTIRWGVLGTGVMARSMTEALQARSDAAVVAVASRDLARATQFAGMLGIREAYGTYDDLARADGVDALYVATTNDRHLEATVRGLEAGTPVLCEKPLGMNGAEVERMVTASRRKGVLLMEAMWMRFQPFLTKVEQLIASGAIGQVRHVQADFCIGLPYAADNRWFAPELGGGSLLDLGIYPMTLAYHLLGPPEASEAVAQLAPTGVDAQIGVTSRHPDGALSVLTSSLVTDGAWEATVAGTAGRLRIHSPFHHSPLVTHHRGGEQVARYDTSYEVSGLQFEIDEFHACLVDGRAESARHPLDDTIAIAEWMTELRRQCSIRYPGE